MLEKLLEKAPKSLAVLSAVGMLYGCGGERCEAPLNITYESVEEVQSMEQPYEKAVIKETETETGNFYLMATCPSGCSYDSSVGCCWCPN